MIFFSILGESSTTNKTYAESLETLNDSFNWETLLTGKFGALFASIPFSIFAAVYCVLFGIVGMFVLFFLLT